MPTSSWNVRCRLLRRHRWTLRTTDEGERYLVCVRCGRERFRLPIRSGDYGTPTA